MPPRPTPRQIALLATADIPALLDDPANLSSFLADISPVSGIPEQLVPDYDEAGDWDRLNAPDLYE